jgi:hypothetical protein
MSAAVARFTLLMLCACKQPVPAPIEHPPTRAAESAAPTAAQKPVRDPFELEDEPDDPAAALEAARHNCCDEMPADEIRAHSDQTTAPAKP